MTSRDSLYGYHQHHPPKELSKTDLTSRVQKAARAIGIENLIFDDDPRRCNSYLTTIIVKDALTSAELGYLTAFTKHGDPQYRVYYSQNRQGEVFTNESFEINPDPLVLSSQKRKEFWGELKKSGLTAEAYHRRGIRFYTDHEVDIDTAVREGKLQPLYR